MRKQEVDYILTRMLDSFGNVIDLYGMGTYNIVHDATVVDTMMY